MVKGVRVKKKAEEHEEVFHARGQRRLPPSHTHTLSFLNHISVAYLLPRLRPQLKS
jgi:hypothetical protein